jgi:hypothetical protein
MATLSYVIPAAALGLILWSGILGAQPLDESGNTRVDLTNITPDTRGDLKWKLSVGSLAIANVLDVSSSWGKCEQNNLLAGQDGRFGAKGVLLKSAIVGGVMSAEWLITRKTPRSRKLFSILNFGSATGIGALAVRNYGIQAPGETGRCR